MTRRYGHAISITHSGSHLTGFQWNGVAYRVVEVLATWHLRARWWEAGELSEAAEGGTVSARAQSVASDRLYYRLRCASGLICEVYHDVVSDAWVLDCVYD